MTVFASFMEPVSKVPLRHRGGKSLGCPFRTIGFVWGEIEMTRGLE